MTVEAQYAPDGTELEAKITFTCPWKYGECHFYPGCDCESWDPETHMREHGPEHAREWHPECWMERLVDAGWHFYDGPDSSYVGDYGVPAGANYSGEIEWYTSDSVFEWHFKGSPLIIDPARDPEGRALVQAILDRKAGNDE